jgi:dual specificity tyrosine-phosphorylation-regulated kinase 2/3/4
MVRMTDHFYFRGHLCIVTELLSINLYELIKANNFSGFSTTLVRRFTTQMLASLQLMRSHRIVHCDLKPEVRNRPRPPLHMLTFQNILLCHPIRSGIKVIDFGSSCLETEKGEFDLLNRTDSQCIRTFNLVSTEVPKSSWA